jgi:hypothetical protein
MRAPDGVPERGVVIDSDLEHRQEQAGSGATLIRSVKVCVPAGGFGNVRVRALGQSPIYGDMRDETALSEPREGGVLLVQIALADEVGGPCRPREST